MPLKIPDDILNNPHLTGEEKMLIAALRQGAKFGETLTTAVNGGAKFGIKGSIAPAIQKLYEQGLIATVSNKVGSGEEIGAVEIRLVLHASLVPKDQKTFLDQPRPETERPSEPEATADRFSSLEVPEDAATSEIAVGPERFAEIAALYSAELLMGKGKVKGIAEIDGTEYVVLLRSEEQCQLRQVVRAKGLELRPSESIDRKFKHKSVEYAIVSPGITVTVTPAQSVPIAEASSSEEEPAATQEGVPSPAPSSGHEWQYARGSAGGGILFRNADLGLDDYRLVYVESSGVAEVVRNPGPDGAMMLTFRAASMDEAEAKFAEYLDTIKGDGGAAAAPQDESATAQPPAEDATLQPAPADSPKGETEPASPDEPANAPDSPVADGGGAAGLSRQDEEAPLAWVEGRDVPVFTIEVNGAIAKCAFLADYVAGKTDYLQIECDALAPRSKFTVYLRHEDYHPDTLPSVDAAARAALAERLMALASAPEPAGAAS